MNKTALITGASSGIGKELALIHARNGGDLVVIARREEKLRRLKNKLEAQYGVKVLVINIDLSEIDSAQRIYEIVKNRKIKIDFLINNAGFGNYGEFFKSDLNKNIEMINVNIVSLVKLTHLFLNDFIKRGSGKILNVSSAVALMSGPLQSTYFATKAFVMSFSNALNEEVKGTNITVTTLLPLATDTEFIEKANMEGTYIFSDLCSKRQVAIDGYVGMIRGKLNVFSGQKDRKALLSLVKFIPRILMLKIIYYMQKK